MGCRETGSYIVMGRTIRTMLYLEYVVREWTSALLSSAETEARFGGSSCQGIGQLAYGGASSCSLGVGLTYLEAQQGGVDWGMGS